MIHIIDYLFISFTFLFGGFKMNVANLGLGLNTINNQTSQAKPQQTGMVDGVLPFGLFMGEPTSPVEKNKQENQTNTINSFESALYNIMNQMITQSVQNTQNNSINSF